MSTINYGKRTLIFLYYWTPPMKKCDRDKVNLENYLLLGRGGYKYLTTLPGTTWSGVFFFWRDRCSEEKVSYLYYRCARLEVQYSTCGFYFKKWISFSSPVVCGRQNTRMWCIPYCMEGTVPPGCMLQKHKYEFTSNFR